MAIPALAATLLLGAIGLPLPIGVAAVLAGSLAALGNLQWGWTATNAVTASFAGDMIAYGIGRAVSENFLARHGRWVGYSPERKKHIQSLLQKWGGITVIISRTLISSLSSVVSLLAGVSRYRSFISWVRTGWPAGLDLNLPRPRLRDRQQYRRRQLIPRQFERAADRAGRADRDHSLSGRIHADRNALKAVASAESAAISLCKSRLPAFVGSE